MKKAMLAALGALWLVASCGSDTCVLGVGNCEWDSVVGALSLTASATSVAVSGTVTFTTSGGSSPYTYSIISGSGSINSSTGEFTAPATAGTSCVRVTDNGGATDDLCIQVTSSS